MFAKAIGIEKDYTAPVILSRKTIGGACSSSIGAFVDVNRDGWIVTAGHIILQLQQLTNDAAKAQSGEATRLSIENDKTLDRKAKKKAIAKTYLPTRLSIAPLGGDGTVFNSSKRIRSRRRIFPSRGFNRSIQGG